MLFDEVYPDGPPVGILTVNHEVTKKRQKKTKQPRNSQQSAFSLAVSDPVPTSMNRRLTNLRMCPILATVNNDQPTLNDLQWTWLIASLLDYHNLW